MAETTGRRRILLLINSLEGGGAENVMVRVAAGLAARAPDAEIRLALLDDLPAAYPAPPGVELVRLDSRGAFWRSIRGVRRLVADWRPDVVLSFLARANCAAVLARRQGGGPLCVISERVNTTSHFGTGPRERVLKAMIARLYPRADRVIAVSRGVGDDLRDRYGVPAERIEVIHNPVDIDTLRARAAAPPAIDLPGRFFVSVGRLVPNKGGDILLRAFARHAEPARHLVMLGDGPERDRLAALARKMGLAERVHMPGYLDNPQAVVARADAYVSASRSEGFPNALVEAMALGRPVIATDCASGPREILQGPPPAGLLVPVDDVDALARALDLVNEAETRHSLAGRASDRAQDFRPGPVVSAYARVLGV
ncbi:Glycosyl transferase group 1 [Oceanicola granulosus HTCC2516]|uniref:Glycosyl transferase group 1 n=1 Tax=Oceanicola granulosus (strain ATCC BAA-861 / DSM 15982 / KCTC 12143 / HTCC2516) TaxID=314256 RepID=Q2CER6_OCEGH|nr:glycosyltransferase [Oceanicola granulosus]EAR51192.1 Glycosyl transferase group 1 [Oceanicola granulosus HTCC2516]